MQWRKWPAYRSWTSAGDQIADATNHGYQVVTSFVEQARANAYKAIDQRQCLDTIIENPPTGAFCFTRGIPRSSTKSRCRVSPAVPVHPERGEARDFAVPVHPQQRRRARHAVQPDRARGAALHLVGRLTGYAPRWFTYFIGDAHIYENQLDMLKGNAREPFASPQLILSDRVPDYAQTGRYEPQWLEKIEPADFSLEGLPASRGAPRRRCGR